ncbi:MAG: DUF6544 family protein [Spirochaetota bacterium]
MRNLWFMVIVSIVAFAGIVFFLIETRGLRTHYDAAVARMQQTTPARVGVVTSSDIAHLPPIVQKYLAVTGSLGREKIRNFRVTWDGALRSDAHAPWMSAVMLQENFFEDYSRDFYLTAFMKGLPVSVWHSYQEQHATMQVKIASLFPIVDLRGEELTTAETVTLFNDMCLLAPAALVDKRISWRAIDALQAEATFTNGKYRIRAVLKFRENGELVDFISDDRYYLTADNKLRRERWSTPLSEYREFAGRRVVSRGEAVWHLKEGSFAYGKFVLKSIEYNVR